MYNTSIPEELRKLKRWVVWDHRKAPHNPNRPESGAMVNNPLTWGTYEQAVQTMRSHPEKFRGIGFQGGGSPYILIDFDFKANDEYEIPCAVGDFIAWLGTYWEFSPSMKGVHIIGRVDKDKLKQAGWTDFKGSAEKFFLSVGSEDEYELPEGSGAELYTGNRYLTMTGDTGAALPIVDVTGKMLTLLRKLRKAEQARQEVQPPRVVAPSSDAGYATRIEKALLKEDIKRTWNGEDAGGDGSKSSGDFFLISRLCFWLDGREDWLDMAFRESGRMRPKWDEKRGGSKTYGQLTIQRALEKWNGLKYNPTLPSASFQPVRTTADDWKEIAPALRQAGSKLIARSHAHHLVKKGIQRVLDGLCDQLEQGNVGTVDGKPTLFLDGLSSLGTPHEVKYRLNQLQSIGINIEWTQRTGSHNSHYVGVLPEKPEGLRIWSVSGDFSFAPYRVRVLAGKGLAPILEPQTTQNSKLTLFLKMLCQTRNFFIPSECSGALISQIPKGYLLGLRTLKGDGTPPCLPRIQPALRTPPRVEPQMPTLRPTMPLESRAWTCPYHRYPRALRGTFMAIVVRYPTGPPQSRASPPMSVLALPQPP